MVFYYYVAMVFLLLRCDGFSTTTLRWFFYYYVAMVFYYYYYSMVFLRTLAVFYLLYYWEPEPYGLCDARLCSAQVFNPSQGHCNPPLPMPQPVAIRRPRSRPKDAGIEKKGIVRRVSKEPEQKGQTQDHTKRARSRLHGTRVPRAPWTSKAGNASQFLDT